MGTGYGWIQGEVVLIEAVVGRSEVAAATVDSRGAVGRGPAAQRPR
jgi:hypothetical protein